MTLCMSNIQSTDKPRPIHRLRGLLKSEYVVRNVGLIHHPVRCYFHQHQTVLRKWVRPTYYSHYYRIGLYSCSRRTAAALYWTGFCVKAIQKWHMHIHHSSAKTSALIWAFYALSVRPTLIQSSTNTLHGLYSNNPSTTSWLQRTLARPIANLYSS